MQMLLNWQVLTQGQKSTNNPDWNQTTTSADDFIENKPTTITTVQASAITANTAKISADGSVATHSDVSNAGSGKIITDAERTKLEGIATSAEVNVQGDWTQATTSEDDFIKNKPTTITTGQASAITANTAKVSADGVVTTHSDVTDAGSGKIITDAERTTLGTALQAETQTLSQVLTQGNTANMDIDMSGNKITDVLEITSTHGAKLTTTGIWMNASDRNRKTNIKALDYGLAEILQLVPVQYDYKSNGSHSIGFIAQALAKLLPELVAGEEGDKSVAYSLLTSVLVKAIQEMQAEIIDLRDNVQALQTENSQLQKVQDRMTQLESLVSLLVKDASVQTEVPIGKK